MHRCSTCGYSWEQGQSGSHRCVPILIEKIAVLEHDKESLQEDCRALAEANKNQTDRIHNHLKKAAKLSRTLSFFASVIKSGERWTDACEKALRECLDHE